MDVSSFLGGQYLAAVDIVQPTLCTVQNVSQAQVGDDEKLVLQLDQFSKPLLLNKTNLRVLATAFGVDSNSWLSRPVELYRDQAPFQGRMVDCVRCRIPQAAVVQAPAAQPAPVAAAPQPVAAGAPAAPIAAPQAGAAPWEAAQQNNPPSA